MTRDDTAALIARRLDAINRHDVAALASMYADDCIVDSPSGGGVVKGRTAIDDVNRAWFSGFPDLAFSPDDLLIDGDRVAWIVTAEGTDSGGFMGLPPTGRPFNLPMVLLSTVSGGRIVRERRIYDFTGMLMQIGILKARSTGAAPPDVRAMPPAATSAGFGDRGAMSPTREQIATLLSRRQQAWGSRDVDGIARQHAASCVMDSHLAGRVEGPSAIARLYKMWFTAFPDSRLATEEVIVDGDRIAEIATLSGTDSGGFLGLPATRKPFQLPSVWFYTLTNLQFVYVRPIYDFTGMLVQIGVLKPKPV
jgi:steroid delta-isomerase-like uncharacterized protein